MSTHRSCKAALCLFLKPPESRAMTLYSHISKVSLKSNDVQVILHTCNMRLSSTSLCNGEQHKREAKISRACLPCLSTCFPACLPACLFACLFVWQPACLSLGLITVQFVRLLETRVYQSDPELKLKKVAFVCSRWDWGRRPFLRWCCHGDDIKL